MKLRVHHAVGFVMDWTYGRRKPSGFRCQRFPGVLALVILIMEKFQAARTQSQKAQDENNANDITHVSQCDQQNDVCQNIVLSICRPKYAWQTG
jgi:hypothetical protein